MGPILPLVQRRTGVFEVYGLNSTKGASAIIIFNLHPTTTPVSVALNTRKAKVYTGMFPVGDTSCRTLIDVCVCVCVCVSVCPPTYR